MKVIRNFGFQLDDLEHRLQTSTRNFIDKIEQRLDSLEKRLEANSLTAALKRGFSYLSDKDGNLIHSTAQLHPGKRVQAYVQDGSRPMEVLSEDSA